MTRYNKKRHAETHAALDYTANVPHLPAISAAGLGTIHPVSGMRLPRLHRTRSSTAHDKAEFIIADFAENVNAFLQQISIAAVFFKNSQFHLDFLYIFRYNNTAGKQAALL